MGGGRSDVWRSRERAHNKLIISSKRARIWDRRSRAGLADCNNDGLLRTFAQLIGEGLFVQEGVKKHTAIGCKAWRYKLKSG